MKLIIVPWVESLNIMLNIRFISHEKSGLFKSLRLCTTSKITQKVKIVKSYGISGSLLQLLTSFLTNRKQLMCPSQRYQIKMERGPQWSSIRPCSWTYFIQHIHRRQWPLCQQSHKDVRWRHYKIICTSPNLNSQHPTSWSRQHVSMGYRQTSYMQPKKMLCSSHL